MTHDGHKSLDKLLQHAVLHCWVCLLCMAAVWLSYFPVCVQFSFALLMLQIPTVMWLPIVTQRNTNWKVGLYGKTCSHITVWHLKTSPWPDHCNREFMWPSLPASCNFTGCSLQDESFRDPPLFQQKPVWSILLLVVIGTSICRPAWLVIFGLFLCGSWPVLLWIMFRINTLKALYEGDISLWRFRVN